MATTFIDEKNRSKEEVESLEVAEAARETTWDHPSFVAELFMGNLQLGSLYPYPAQDLEDRKIGDDYLERLETFFSENVDADEIDHTGTGS